MLIPRQDTETLVEAVLELRKNEPSTCLLDLCSGSGCIPSALSVHLSGVTGAVLELSPEAMGYLRQNLKRHAPPAGMYRRGRAAPAGGTAAPAVPHHHLQPRPISPQQIWSSFSRKSPVNRKPPCSAAPTGWTSTEKLTPCGSRHSSRLAGWCMRWEQDRHRTWKRSYRKTAMPRYTPSPTSQASDASCWGSGRNFGICSGAIGNTIDRKERIHSLYQIKDDNLWQKQI